MRGNLISFVFTIGDKIPGDNANKLLDAAISEWMIEKKVSNYYTPDPTN